MCAEVDALYIKSVRAKYGMTQKAFARVLGIGEASIIRYEQGQPPTKAMANLIRAAAKPEFMVECLERDGKLLPDDQREKAERIVYSLVSFDEKGEVMDINEIYELTVQQEILNERAAVIAADATKRLATAISEEDEPRQLVLRDVLRQLAILKPSIVWEKNKNIVKLAELRGTLNCLESMAQGHVVAVA